MNWFPPNEDVVRRLALKNPFQFTLELGGSDKPGITAGLTYKDSGLLATEPITEVSEGQFF